MCQMQITVAMMMAVSEAVEYFSENPDPLSLGPDLKKLEQEFAKQLERREDNIFTGVPKGRLRRDCGWGANHVAHPHPGIENAWCPGVHGG